MRQWVALQTLESERSVKKKVIFSSLSSLFLLSVVTFLELFLNLGEQTGLSQVELREANLNRTKYIGESSRNLYSRGK